MKPIRADRRVGLLLAGVVLLAFLGLGATVALPASDPSLEAKPHELTAEEAKGMDLYKSEGCWYCHTGYIRESSVDAMDGRNSATVPDDIAGRSPAMLGLERVGLDLSGGSARALRDHPPGLRLSDAEIEALVAYLTAER